MVEENISQEFRLKNIDEASNIKQYELMSETRKNIYTTLNYITHFLILAYTISRWIYFLLLLFWLVFL